MDFWSIPYKEKLSELSHDIDMNLGPLTKPYRINTTTWKKFVVDVVSTNFDVIFIFLIHG